MVDPKRQKLNLPRIIAEAIAIEMDREEKILVLGEDVGKIGGVFGTTRGLLTRFGEKRVRDMPISEMAFSGMGIGLSMAGYRPLVEIMFADFIGVCFEQLLNAMSKIPYMSGGTVKIPMVVKTAAGSIGSAAQHSQCLWGTMAHLPGIQVIAPSNPYDYKGLMASALDSDNPIIYMEHKRQLIQDPETFLNDRPVPKERYTVPIGKASISLCGSDLTIVSASAQVEEALAAAEVLSHHGISAEVVDLRTIVPLDLETVIKSVTKTERLVIVDEDYRSFGLSGEIMARVHEELDSSQLKQCIRHTMPDIPLPAARSLEDAIMPNRNSIANVCLDLAKKS